MLNGIFSSSKFSKQQIVVRYKRLISVIFPRILFPHTPHDFVDTPHTMLGNNFIRNSLHYLMAKPSCQRWASSIAAANQLEAKTLQETALAENCILVDEFDRAIGQSSKRDCHRVSQDGRIKLHRAFSVFLFNSNGDMLIQKRSSHKVTM